MFKSSRTSRRLTLTGLAAASALVLAACGGGAEEAQGPTANDDGVTTLTVGATPVPHGQILQYVSEELGPGLTGFLGFLLQIVGGPPGGTVIGVHFAPVGGRVYNLGIHKRTGKRE